MKASILVNLASVTAMSLVMMLAACNKKDGAAGADGGTATSTATGGKKAKTTRKVADVKTAYKAELEDMSKMKDPLDKKVGAFVAKVGAPDSDSGRKKTWMAVDGDKCTKFELDTKDGSLMDQTADKAECGI